MLISTFVSFAKDDKYFVDLLVELLRFHAIKVWCSNTSLTAGSQWRPIIHEAIKEADSLAVVVSKNSSRSDWVKREVEAFLMMKPNAPVIPLCLDDTPCAEIDSDLEHFQLANFRISMLEGCRTFLSALGGKFLPEGHIVVSNRRSVTDRRNLRERRVSPISQRVRIGFWKAYQAKTQAGKFDVISSLGGFLHGATEAIKIEAEKYVYKDITGKLIPASEVLDNASKNVFNTYFMPASSTSRPTAIFVIEDLANFVCKNYTVTIVDRRYGKRRG